MKILENPMISLYHSVFNLSSYLGMEIKGPLDDFLYDGSGDIDDLESDVFDDLSNLFSRRKQRKP